MARTTTTALLRTQASRLKTQQSWEDQMLDYEWSNSAKTREDYNAYLQHYQTRMDDAENPQDALSFQKRIDSANRAFISNEIQRASIDVIEGNMSEEQKLNKLTELYSQAYAYGNYDLAQQMRLQIDNQIVKIQQGYATGGSGGGYGGASSNDTTIKNLINDTIADIKSGMAVIAVDDSGNAITLGDISNYIKTYGEDGLDQIATQLGYQDAQMGMEMLKDVIGGQIQQLQDLAAQTTDPAVQKTLYNSIEKLKSTKLDIAGDGNKGTLSYTDIVEELNNRANGNGRYTFAPDGENGFSLIEYGRQDIMNGNNQVSYDSEGNPIFKTQYGASSPLNAQYGYQANEDVIYEFKDGQLRPLFSQELKRDNSGKVVVGKNQVSQQELYQKMGLYKNDDGSYTIADNMAELMRRSGFQLDKSNILAKDAFVFDPVTGLPETVSPDGRKAVVWKPEQDRLVPVVQEFVTPGQYLQQQGYTQDGTGTTDVLGSRMKTDLQPAAGAALLQAQRNADFVQGAGTSGVLQRAASAKQINAINANEIQKLKVQEQQRQQAAIKVQPIQTPKVSGVVNYEPKIIGFGVKPYTAPKLNVSTAPSTSMKSGGTSLQGGTPKLQGGSGNLQGGSLSVLNGSVQPKLTVR